MFPVVKARVSAQFDPASELPKRLQLFSINHRVIETLIIHRCSLVLRKWQLKSDHAEFFEPGRLHIEREGLARSLRVQILIPNEFRVEPRIGEFSAGECEGTEPAWVIGGVCAVDGEGLSGGVLIRGLVCGNRIIQIAGSKREAASELIVQLRLRIEAQPDPLPEP